METTKNIFNEVFKAVIDFCGIKPSQIAVEIADGNENTIRTWRTRGLPKESNFYFLTDAIGKILQDSPQTVVRCEKQKAELEGCLKPVWIKYNAPEAKWNEDKSVAENLQDFITAAYEAAKARGESKIELPKQVKRLIAFNLDGALIKGFRYSWAILFKAVGLSTKETVKLKEAFESGKISYPEWCRSDCEILGKKGLTYEMVRKTVLESGAVLTENLVPAIKKLKENGHKVAIISGGADSVLYSLLPNANELFDEIFINKLEYDEETGILKDIIPTQYDWDKYGNGVAGKEAGLIRLCERYGVNPEDSVFVGDDYNDVGAMAAVGMKIFIYSYKPLDPARGLNKRPEIRKIPDDVIYEPGNDLMRIANRVINWDFGDADYTD
ncbi:MAG: HAD family hydrolase [Clostridia bacterium]|nr:HAD family hydrolase [Clostridia bacterium]